MADRGGQLGLAERFIVAVEAAGEKLHHLCLDRIRGLAGDDRMGAMFEKRDPWISKGRGGMCRRYADRRLAGFLALAVAVVGMVPLAAAAENEPGAKLPRFVSLRSDLVNLRVGPGETYPILWVLTRKEMPVEIIREFEHWRMIRDWQGTEGWVHERMVARKRGIVVKGGVRALHRQPDPASEVIARAEPGVFARLAECRGAWCRIETAEITGWIQRGEVWGVYPDEAVQ